MPRTVCAIVIAAVISLDTLHIVCASIGASGQPRTVIKQAICPCLFYRGAYPLSILPIMLPKHGRFKVDRKPHISPLGLIMFTLAFGLMGCAVHFHSLLTSSTKSLGWLTFALPPRWYRAALKVFRLRHFTPLLIHRRKSNHSKEKERCNSRKEPDWYVKRLQFVTTCHLCTERPGLCTL